LPKLEALEQACLPSMVEIPELSSLIHQVGQEGSTLPFVNLLEAFFEAIGTPTRLSQLNLGPETHSGILEALVKHKATGNYFDIQEPDHRRILALMA
ncbi:MAG: hypothetical protein EBS08_01310, partial [Cytophagia bacterium]|nr:hypothetical protein [Cytophagia bacterium]